MDQYYPTLNAQFQGHRTLLELRRGAEKTAARAKGRGAGAAEGAVGGRETFDFKLDKGLGADGEFEAAVAAVDESTGGDNAAAFFFNDANCFVGGATGGPDVFDDEDVFARVDAEAAAEGKMAAGIAFDEEGAGLGAVGAGGKGAGDFVADDDSAESRGDDAIKLEVVEFSG